MLVELFAGNVPVACGGGDGGGVAGGAVGGPAVRLIAAGPV